MKIMGMLFTVLTLFLSASPCCSGEYSCEKKVEIKYHENSQQDLPQSEIPCSPFYSCGTCFGFGFQSFEFNILMTEFPKDRSFNIFYFYHQSDGYKLLPLKPPRQQI